MTDTVTISDLAQTVTFPNLSATVTIPSYVFTEQLESGVYDLTGADVALNRLYQMALDSGSYVVTGAGVDFIRSLIMASGAGSYTLTGQDIAFHLGFYLATDAGVYSLSGSDAAFLRDLVLSGEAGSFAITGQDMGFVRDLIVATDAGTYALTGADVSLKFGFLFNVDAGSYTLSGTAASLLHNASLTAGAGSYSLTGGSAGLNRGHTLVGGGASYTLTGADLTLQQYLFDVLGNAPDLAYSLRRLSSSYSGPAIRVRRSSDNSVQDIYFDGEDLDTSALSSFVGAGSGYIVRWYDQSGNDDYLVQTTNADQPRIVNAGTIETFNSLPAINFTAQTQGLTCTGMTDVRSGSMMLNFSDLSPSYVFYLGHSVNAHFHPYIAPNPYWLHSSAALSNLRSGSWRVNESSITPTSTNRATSTDYKVNFVSTAANASFNQLADDRALSRSHLGMYAELILWDADISSDITALEANQAAYWGV